MYPGPITGSISVLGQSALITHKIAIHKPSLTI